MNKLYSTHLNVFCVRWHWTLWTRGKQNVLHILTLARFLTVSHITLTEKLARCAMDSHIKWVGNWMTHWANSVVVRMQSPAGGQILHEYLRDHDQGQCCSMSHPWPEQLDRMTCSTFMGNTRLLLGQTSTVSRNGLMGALWRSKANVKSHTGEGTNTTTEERASFWISNQN